MANISGFLQNILSARFGKDVRQSIHDAIEEIDKVADTAKDSATAMAKTATEKASEASGYASSAKTSEENAKSYMESAKTSENNSKTSETNAKTSETNAKASEINAKVSEENAQAVFESLPEDYGTLSKEFYEVAIKQKASGEEIHVTDSSNAKVREFALFGKAKQQTTQGNQLINLPDIEAVKISGINWSCKNGAVTASGTASDRSSSSMGSLYYYLPKIEAGTYFVSGSTANTKVFAQVKNSDGTFAYPENRSFSLEGNEISVMVYCQVEKDEVVDETIYPMLNKGTTALPWEPFTGGQPSPSPEFPQEIELPNGEVVVKSCGKNLLNYPTTDVNNNFWLVGDVPIAGVTSHKAKKVFLPKGTYVFSFKSNIEKYDYTNLHLYNFDGKKINTFSINNKVGYTELIFTVDEDVYALSSYSRLIDTFSEIQIEKGNQRTPYEPYKETTAKIPTTDFAGIPVSSGGNYTDSNGQQWIANEIVKYANGSGERVQRVEKKRITSDMPGTTWATKNGTYNRYMIRMDDLKRDNLGKLLCTYLQNILMPDAYNERSVLGVFPDGSSSTITYIGFINPDWVTIDDFKAFLDANEIYVLYELATPIRTPLTAEEIAEIEKLSTFYPVTNISNDADCGMEVTYLADSKLYIDNRLAQIEQALIANI